MIDPSKIATRRVFVDTSAYVALFNDKDVDHVRIVAGADDVLVDDV